MATPYTLDETLRRYPWPDGYRVGWPTLSSMLVVTFRGSEIGRFDQRQILRGADAQQIWNKLDAIVTTHQRLSALEGKIAKAVAAAALHARKTRLPPYWALRANRCSRPVHRQ